MSEAKISSRNKNRDSVNFATVYRLLWTFGVYIIRRKYASSSETRIEEESNLLNFHLFQPGSAVGNIWRTNNSFERFENYTNEKFRVSIVINSIIELKQRHRTNNHSKPCGFHKLRNIKLSNQHNTSHPSFHHRVHENLQCN